MKPKANLIKVIQKNLMPIETSCTDKRILNHKITEGKLDLKSKEHLLEIELAAFLLLRFMLGKIRIMRTI